jgi:hypothetical protein
MPEKPSHGTIRTLVENGSLVSLADSLSALRSQLEDAHLRHLEASARAQALGENLISFGLSEVTVSFEVVASRSQSPAAKLVFWVASAEVQGKLDKSVRHSVTIKLRVTESENTKELTLGGSPDSTFRADVSSRPFPSRPPDPKK